MSNCDFFETLKKGGVIVDCVNVCVLLGKVSESARGFRKKWNPPSLFWKSLYGFPKSSGAGELGISIDVFVFYLACKSATHFQISALLQLLLCSRTYTHAWVFWRSCARYHHMVTQLQNGSLLLEVLLQVIYHSYIFQGLFLLHFFLFHFQLSFLITHHHSVVLMLEVMLLNG